MIFAEFYQRAVNSEKLIAACGDRAVIVLDGRNTPETWHEIAKSECAKRGFLAYTLNKGETFTRSNPITKLIVL